MRLTAKGCKHTITGCGVHRSVVEENQERGPGQGLGVILSTEVQALQDEATFGSVSKRNR